MRRRVFIATVAGTSLSLAGCFGDDPPGQDPTDPPPEESPIDGNTPTPTPNTTPAPGHDVTVETTLHQYGYVSPTTPDSIGISGEDQAYLLVEVQGNDLPAYDAFELVVGDRTISPDGDAILYRTGWIKERSEYSTDGGGWLVFPHDRVTEGVDVRLTWPGGEHQVTGEERALMGNPPPSFDVALSVPEQYDGAESPGVDLEVTNEGDTRARFLGALNRVGPAVAYTPVQRIATILDPGETWMTHVQEDWSGRPPEDRLDDGEADVTYHFHYQGGNKSAGIELTT